MAPPRPTPGIPTETATPKLSTPSTMPATGRAPPFEVLATVLSSTTKHARPMSASVMASVLELLVK